MVALMAGLAIMLILSTVAVQSWKDVVRRDAEAEMMFRAQDIVRAIKRFQVDQGKLPLELKELMEPGKRNQYYLRHLWKDPLVKDGKWQLIYANPAGGIYDPTAQPVGQPGAPGGLGGLNPPPGAPGQPGGIGQPSGFPPSSAPPATGIGATTDITGKGGAPTDPTGLPIAGVKSKCTDKPFRRWRDKTEYSEWVFTIFDLDQRGAFKPNPTPTTPGGTPGTANPTFPPKK